MAQQKFKVSISKDYTPEERVALGLEIIDLIIDRTGKGKDKNNKDFTPSYSKEYASSFKFKLAGKKKGTPNLSLSGEMLNSLTVLDTSSGEITIGIPLAEKFNNDKAEGNIKGTYGSSKADPSKSRDFMGISATDLKDITSQYPTKKKGKNIDLLKTLLATEASREVTDVYFGVDSIEGEIDA